MYSDSPRSSAIESYHDTASFVSMENTEGEPATRRMDANDRRDRAYVAGHISINQSRRSLRLSRPVCILGRIAVDYLQ